MKHKSNYKIIGLVGRGQFGRVLAAIERSSGTLVALKELKSRQLPTSSFLRELNFLVTLNHFNIVTCRALEHWQNNRYIVMDYCEGGTLRKAIDSRQLSLTQSLKLVIDLLLGLKFAHERGIIHRDIKPENILLKISDRSWTAHIADFGIAKLNQEVAEGMGNTGSPAYMAPEQFYGQYSYSCDLYAAGIILYELVVGERPFSGMPQELLLAHLNQPAIVPCDLPFLLRSAISKSLQKMPRRRFPNAQSMLESLQLTLAVLEAEPYELTNTVPSESVIDPVAELVLPYQITHLAIASEQVYLGSGDRMYYINTALSEIEKRRELILDSDIRSLQLNPQGCFIVTSASIYCLPQDTTSEEFRFVTRTLLPIATFPTDDLVCTIDPQGYWLAVSYLPRKSRTPAFEIFSLPNCQLKRSQINRQQWDTLIAWNSRRGGGIYQNLAQDTEFHLFNRRGDWLANFTIRVRLDKIYYDPLLSNKLLATETDNPGVVILITLEIFSIERVYLDLTPIAIAFCPQGYLVCDYRGKIALIDRDSYKVRYYQIPLLAGFEATAIATSDTWLLVASVAGERSHLQQFSLELFDL